MGDQTDGEELISIVVDRKVEGIFPLSGPFFQTSGFS